MKLSYVDDKLALITIRDLSGGQNNRQFEQNIADNEATVLYNVKLDTPGERSLREGITLIEDLSNDAGTGALGFEPDGGTNELLVTHGTKLEGWVGAGVFTEHKTDFTSGLQTTIIKAGESGEGDVALISNGTDNMFRMLQAHTFQDLGNINTSPPLSSVMTYYRNRVWVFKDNELHWSTAYPADYSAAFDRTTNYYRIPAGTERFIVGIRDTGLLVGGADSIWGINPSLTPVATDKPEKILDMGCVTPNTAVQVGDDVYFMASDGVRGVFRTVQDKLQMGQSFPLSFKLKSEFENINWGQITKACAVCFDNKYLLALASGTSTYNNQVWCYYPAFQSWVIINGWNVARWAKLKVSGEERLYYIDSNDGSVYRAFYGTSDNGTAITYQEESKSLDFGFSSNYKSGGEIKVKCEGGTGILIVSIAIDNDDYIQLGTLDLTLHGVTFPVTFPVNFNTTTETEGIWHLDNLGKFKRIKYKLYCSTVNAVLKILESSMTTYIEEYLSE